MKPETKSILWSLAWMLVILAFAVACLGFANYRYEQACLAKGDTVGTTSQGYKVCVPK